MKSEITIELPTVANGTPERVVSYRWCEMLHKTLKPLLQYKLANGSNAVEIVIAANTAKNVPLDYAFNATDFLRPEDYLFAEDMKIPPFFRNFVCSIRLMQTNNICIKKMYLCLVDFQGDAKTAKGVFAKVIAHLNEHAVTQTPPEWLKKTIEALKS